MRKLVRKMSENERQARIIGRPLSEVGMYDWHMLYPVVREDTMEVVAIVYADSPQDVPEWYEFVSDSPHGEYYVDTGYTPSV